MEEIKVKNGIAFWQVWLTGALFTFGWFAVIMEDGATIDTFTEALGIVVAFGVGWPLLLGVDISLLAHGIGG